MIVDKSDEVADHGLNEEVNREHVIAQLIHLKAFDRKHAVLENKIEMNGEQKYIFDELVEEGAILEEEKEDNLTYYYLSEDFKHYKSYRKQVVMGMSIPLLVFFILLIIAGAVAIIYEIVN